MNSRMLIHLTLIVLCGCTETTYIADEAVGSSKFPSYFSVPTSSSTAESLDCVLRELTLVNSNNSFEKRVLDEGWEIDIIYGKNGVVGGGQIGEIRKDARTMTFFYRPAIGNFGLDTWNVERVVPNALEACA